MKVGSKIVALVDSEAGRFKKGDVFTLLEVFQWSCECGTMLMVDIGLKNRKDVYCGCTNCLSVVSYDYCYYPASYFRELDTDYTNITAEELIEELEVYMFNDLPLTGTISMYAGGYL